MDKERYFLGIDTSNYTTSAALIDEDMNIIADSRQMLKVEKNSKGLRQSQALFEHVGNMAEVIAALKLESCIGKVSAVAASERPRPQEGSYMPVFRAGESYGKVLASAFGIPYYSFSHQEGHIEAARMNAGFKGTGEFLCFHLSGGTTEIIKCKELDTAGYDVEIIGGTLDISIGQLIDRAGVALGLSFPCGMEMDRLAIDCTQKIKENIRFSKIKCVDCQINLSGIETQTLRFIDSGMKTKSNYDISSDSDFKDKKASLSEEENIAISKALFGKIGEALENMIKQSRQKTGIMPIIMAGGVSSSKYVRELLCDDRALYFGKAELSRDNAVGTAILGMKRYLNDEAD